MKNWIALIALAAACSGTRSSRTPPVEGPASRTPAPTVDPGGTPVKSRILEKDETVSTASGATFTASAGWMLELVGVELVPRERDDRTVLVSSDAQHDYVFERVK